MAEADTHTVQELQANLGDYRLQLQQVETLLLSDHTNAELREMYDNLAEVIQMTEDLLREAGMDVSAAAAAPPPLPAAAAAAAAAGPSSAAAAAARPSGSDAGASDEQQQEQQQQQLATPAELNLPAMLPASVADQIRKAQVRQALLGQGNPSWAVGAPCLALYAADGQYYPATVKAVSEGGKFVVVYEGYGNEEELEVGQVQPPVEQEAGYTGVAAPKRRRVEEAPAAVLDEAPPKWLEIKPEDDEKTVARKKKLLKSYKSKKRFAEMDLKTREKQADWQSFLKGKGGKPKSGFFTGRKKESMFKVPEGGKVGVIGSGKGVTEYKKQKRHEFSVE